MTRILCIDIGSGTQDALYYEEPERRGDAVLENCPKFILPAPAQRVAARIRELTAAGRPVYLHGDNMGGGFFHALKAHLEAGLEAAAHPEAALALGDDPERVRGLGVRLAQRCPAGHSPVPLADYSPEFWRGFLAMAGLGYPDLVLAAAQDHGFHPGSSNRLGRFQLWRQFLSESGGRAEDLLFETPPPQLTRLATLQRAAGHALVADTGAAAVLGALFVDEVEARQHRRGVCVVNLGNSHIIAFLLYAGCIWGVYEHHTGLRTAEELLTDLAAFRSGELTNQAVLDSWGHGCMTLEAPHGAGGFEPLYVLGPRRGLLAGHGELLVPGGDMMLAGAFGLLKGWRLKSGR
jgi:uncharacterized protein (DUF1786 family)